MDGSLDTPLDRQIAAVRRFTRFYTRHLGVLREGLLDSPFALTEARVLYELAQAPELGAAELARRLALDAGYLSRILRRFETDGLIARDPVPEDGRRATLRLTEAGREAFAGLDAASRAQVRRLLAALPASARPRLVAAMRTIEALLDTDAPAPWLIRPLGPGDGGWVVESHGRLYAQEYGWNAEFEALVAEIVAAFLRAHDPACEGGWIAERDGAPVGSVFVVRQDARTAKLRLLLVEPEARGLGIGRRLVEHAMGFARGVGYARMTLWTNDVLVAARHIYESAGFVCTAREPHTSFGKDLVSETWERDLTPD
ncbi:MarR family transcriptional regulator [Elioraea sp. Yellowstone]|jgi:DNA-binding MarR family transcriptional regulator/GNAT superfamily N-acetyltransferase|uniref:bifunctional helix-turn-helix transcriptional regulator/GNAT family N-acetyltransferase n=1 Tax=Elioraea sp. Yellowstone TaxID=2592070 RepID=UPI00115359C3|nr:helix-turn-helix domain-containing GNAT family N-acetyltransferase [Elioraea sp. Yellowstone]TQF77237.1 MarR family transcriptional regulator [Elioraea sp. Yellowstone]